MTTSKPFRRLAAFHTVCNSSVLGINYHKVKYHYSMGTSEHSHWVTWHMSGIILCRSLANGTRCLHLLLWAQLEHRETISKDVSAKVGHVALGICS